MLPGPWSSEISAGRGHGRPDPGSVRAVEPNPRQKTHPGAPSAVELHGITKRFPGVVANSDIDLVVQRGTVHALVGENGAGKSTLMKTLYGMHRPDEGTIAVDGKSVSFHSPLDAIKAGIGMVHQHFLLADNLTVLENIVLGAEPRPAAGSTLEKHGAGSMRSPSPTDSGWNRTTSSRISASAPGNAWRSARCFTAARGSSSWTSPPPCWCRTRSTSCSRTCAISRPRA